MSDRKKILEEMHRSLPDIVSMAKCISGMGMMIQRYCALVVDVLGSGDDEHKKHVEEVIKAHRDGTLEDRQDLREVMSEHAEKMKVAIELGLSIMHSDPAELIKKSIEFADQSVAEHEREQREKKEKQEGWDFKDDAPVREGSFKFNGEGNA